MRELFSRAFPRALHLDFLATPNLSQIFADELEPATLLRNLTLVTGTPFNPATDLLILDEIGECSRAVAALKYFAEQTPTWFVAATGSNIGLLQSFPVGKVEHYPLRPLTFQEFLMASGHIVLAEAYAEQVSSVLVHTQLFDQLTDYYFTGGMPEAVATWFARADQPILERVAAVAQIQADLIAGYQRDFGKYAGRVDAQLIAAVFAAVPAQLALVLDESVNRFKFNQIAPRKRRYADFAHAIDWLHQSRLILRNYPLAGRPQTPLAAYRKANQVKLFAFDTSLLNHQLGPTMRRSSGRMRPIRATLRKTLSSRNWLLSGWNRAIPGTAIPAAIETPNKNKGCKVGKEKLFVKLDGSEVSSCYPKPPSANT